EPKSLRLSETRFPKQRRNPFFVKRPPFPSPPHRRLPSLGSRSSSEIKKTDYGKMECNVVIHKEICSSMHPTFSACDARFPGYLKADVVLVEKFCLEKYKFSHGDVITFKSPTDHKQTFVKRLIALPGDWVQVPESSEILKIPEGHCWVEGSSGFDSREGDTCDLATPTNKPSGKKEGYRENFTALIYFVTDYLLFQARFIQLLNLHLPFASRP
ncbi:Mitochondrial inner membrane protease subunit, partial [Musa troglodytarum]